MPLAKEIELPLFHLGTYTSRDGTAVNFDEALMRQLEKNTNFILGAKILQPPVGYDHPAAASENHGMLTGARYSNGVFYVKGRNWSDTLVKDLKSFKRIAYSGEFDDKFSYNEPGTGRAVTVGPTVIGMAFLGSKRPAIKCLKPPSEIAFAEGVNPADVYLTRQEWTKAGVVAEGSEGSKHFAEIENDSTHFFEEGSDDTMDEEKVKKLLADQKKEFEEQLATQKKDFDTRLAATTVDAKRKSEVSEFCEGLGPKGDRKLNLTQQKKLDAILMHPSVTNNTELDSLVRAFAESGSSIIVGSGVAHKRGERAAAEGDRERRRNAARGGKRGEFNEEDFENEDDVEGSMLDTLTSKDFAEMQDVAGGEKRVNEAVREFEERFPAKVSKASYADKLALVERYIAKREEFEE